METKVVAKGDKFIWNNAVKVEVVRSFKTNKFCTIKCSSLLTSWTKKQPLPLPETFVPVDSFDGFDDGEEYWGKGGPKDVLTFSDIEVTEALFLDTFGTLVTSQEELDELIAGYEEDLSSEEVVAAFEAGDVAFTSPMVAQDVKDWSEGLGPDGEFLSITEEEFDALAKNATLVEVIGGTITSGSQVGDGSETTEHLHEDGVRREEDSGLPANVEDAT